MAGKNHIERSFRLLFDDSGGTARDLSGDLVAGSVNGGGLVFDEANMHGVSELVVNFLAGHANSTITANFRMNDTATTGATTVLNGQMPSASVTGIGTLALQWGQNGAAPTSGDPEWEGEYIMVRNEVSPADGGFIHSVTWRPTGSTAPAWGTVS